MERRNGNYGADFQAPQEFRQPAVALEAGSETVPFLSPGESISITLTPFKDHGRPAFVASTIKSRPVLIDIARSLDEKETDRLDQAFGRTMEMLLDDGVISNSTLVLTSNDQNKPDIFIVSVGNPYSDTCLKLYCHKGEYQGKPVLFQDGRATKKTASKIDKELRKAGYKPPTDYGLNKGYSSGRG